MTRADDETGRPSGTDARRDATPGFRRARRPLRGPRAIAKPAPGSFAHRLLALPLLLVVALLLGTAPAVAQSCRDRIDALAQEGVPEQIGSGVIDLAVDAPTLVARFSGETHSGDIDAAPAPDLSPLTLTLPVFWEAKVATSVNLADIDVQVRVRGTGSDSGFADLTGGYAQMPVFVAGQTVTRVCRRAGQQLIEGDAVVVVDLTGVLEAGVYRLELRIRLLGV